MADIVCFGDLLIDFVPTESGLDVSPTFRHSSLRQAVRPPMSRSVLPNSASRSAFMGKVGDEAFGHLLVDTLRREGVDVEHVRIDEQRAGRRLPS